MALVISEVVGVGILLTPATLMRSLGGVWAPIGLWLAMGTLTAAGALCYAELATMFPRAGGAYVFLREGFGRRCAFVYGWMAMLVMDPGITAALGIGVSQYAIAASGAPARFVTAGAIVAIAAVALLATRGLLANARVLRWTATLKFAIVGVLIVVGLSRFLSGAPFTPVHRAGGGFGALASALVAAFFAFGGWWELGRMSEEVQSPRRTMPVALVGGVVLVTTIYVLVTLAFVIAAPASVGETDEAFVAAVGASLFGSAAGRLLAAMVTVTVGGSLAAVLFSAPRTYAAMARDGFLPRGSIWFDVERGRSVVGTTIQASLACVLVALGSFDQILGYFVPAAVFFLGLSATTLWRLPRVAADDIFRTPFFPLPLIVFISLIGVMLLLFATGQPLQTLLGAAVVAIGVLVSVLVV